MGRLVLLSILAFLLILAGFIALNGTLLALSIPIVVFIFAGMYYGPTTLDLHAEREVESDRIILGQPVEVRLLIENRGEQLEEIILENLVPDTLELIEGDSKVIVSLEPNERLELTHVVAGKRGYYSFPDIRVTASDHFGLFRKIIALDAPAHIFVLPESAPLKQVNIRPSQTKVYAGQIPARRGGPGVEYYGTRPYELGDPLRWIDWQTSARHEDVYFTKMFEQERVADVGLILDARLKSNMRDQDSSLLEYSITATAALAETFLNNSNRVGLLTYGSILDWTFPGYGKIQRERILQSLARAEHGTSQIFGGLDNLPTQFFPPKSQIVLISPLLFEDLKMLIRLRARAYDVMVISPDPVDYVFKRMAPGKEVTMAYRIARLERELLLRKLKQAGVQVLNWQTDLPFKQVAHAALSRTPMWHRAVGV